MNVISRDEFVKSCICSLLDTINEKLMILDKIPSLRDLPVYMILGTDDPTIGSFLKYLDERGLKKGLKRYATATWEKDVVGVLVDHAFLEDGTVKVGAIAIKTWTYVEGEMQFIVGVDRIVASFLGIFQDFGFMKKLKESEFNYLIVEILDKFQFNDGCVIKKRKENEKAREEMKRVVNKFGDKARHGEFSIDEWERKFKDRS